MPLGYIVGGLALWYAGMVILGAWIARRMNQNKEAFSLDAWKGAV